MMPIWHNHSQSEMRFHGGCGYLTWCATDRIQEKIKFKWPHINKGWTELNRILVLHTYTHYIIGHFEQLHKTITCSLLVSLYIQAILGGNYLNEEYYDVFVPRRNRNTNTDIEKNSRWRDFVTFQSFFMLKRQHYTLKKFENVKKHNRTSLQYC